MNHRNKKNLSYVLTLIVLLIVVVWICFKFVHISRGEFTDNARVKQQIVPINTRVQGYITEIRFKEFEPVKKGDTLVIIDDSDLKLQELQAKADYENSLAGLSVTHNSIGVASANVEVSNAALEEARVLVENARKDYERYRQLLGQQAVTQQQYDKVKTDYDAKSARYETLLKSRELSSSVVRESRTRIGQNNAGIELAKALLESARLNLSYSIIISPCDGYASRKDIQVGQLVQPGQTLLNIVDTSETWVIANYKETQLKNIQPGNEVKIKVDAIPGIRFSGEVVSISNATGASLSMLPQDNSSGNFVKIRQRIPVRIRFSDSNNSKDMAKLRAGMNVECEILPVAKK